MQHDPQNALKHNQFNAVGAQNPPSPCNSLSQLACLGATLRYMAWCLTVGRQVGDKQPVAVDTVEYNVGVWFIRSRPRQRYRCRVGGHVLRRRLLTWSYAYNIHDAP